MVHVSLKFYLPEHLVHHISIFDLGFAHDFKCVEGVGYFLLCKVDVSEPATSELFTQLELVDSHLRRLLFASFFHPQPFEEL